MLKILLYLFFGIPALMWWITFFYGATHDGATPF